VRSHFKGRGGRGDPANHDAPLVGCNPSSIIFSRTSSSSRHRKLAVCAIVFPVFDRMLQVCNVHFGPGLT
jgi:hypothetical protein